MFGSTLFLQEMGSSCKGFKCAVLFWSGGERLEGSGYFGTKRIDLSLRFKFVAPGFEVWVKN